MSERSEGDVEISIGRYAGRLVARWYVVVACMVVAAIVAVAAGAGTSNTYRGRALIFQGSPLTPSGQPIASAPGTNGATPGIIAHQDAVIASAARTAGLRYGQLAGRISTQLLANGINAKTNTTPYVNITVEGPWRTKVAVAANALAAIVVAKTNTYQAPLISALKARIANEKAELASLTGRVKIAETNLGALRTENGSSPLEHSLAVTNAIGGLNTIYTRQSLVETSYSTDQQTLALATTIEQSQVMTQAIPVKVTASSRRVSLSVALALGFVIGIIAALLSYAVVRRPGTDG